MKKIITGVVFFLIGLLLINLLFGEFNKIKNISNENNLEVVDNKKITTVTSEKKISWGNDIQFTECHSLIDYEDNRIDFFQKEDALLLRKKSEEKGFPVILNEYCKTSDGNKYIFYSNDKVPTRIGRYDKELDIFEASELISFAFDEIRHFGNVFSRNYGDISLEKYYDKYRESKINLNGFGKKDGNIISFMNYGVTLVGNAEVGQQYAGRFLSEWNLDYCNSGLTPGGKLSVCFADVYYSYNFATNKIYEDKICTYFIDDNGNKNTLQKCFQNIWKYKGYDFVSGTEGIKLYQDKSKQLSIIDIDLNKGGISFGGVDQVDTKYLNYHDGLGFINKRFQGKLKTYNLEVEKDNGSFYNFKRQSIKESFGENNFLNIGGSNNELFAVINGQFFNANKLNTTLSFPLKSNGKILNSYIDNDKQKRTVVIDEKGSIKVIEGYEESYINDGNNREVLVGIHPDEDFGKKSSLGRTYMGVIGKNRVIFFIADSKNQSQMKEIALNYGIDESNLVMFDGGPSSQFAYFDINVPGGGINEFYGDWKVPHYFMIYKK